MKSIHFIHYLSAVVIATALVLATFGRVEHDYFFYIQQWDAIKYGVSSYQLKPPNAYGVVHNFFALLDLTRYFEIPRLIFVSTFILAGYILWKRANQLNVQLANWILLLLIINPLVWIHGIKFGSNDVFIAALTLIGIVLYDRRRFATSGIVLGMAISFKFLPIFIVPFMVFQKRKIIFRFFMPLVLTVIILFAIGYSIWGSEVFEPFIFGSERRSKSLSFFRFLRGEFSPIPRRWALRIESFSMYLVLLNCVICFAIYFFSRINWKRIAFLCLFNVLILYKVGHHQFYFTPFIFYLYVLVVDRNIMNQNRTFMVASLCFWIWFSFTEVLIFADIFDHFEIKYQEWISIPTFLLQIIFSVSYISTLFRVERD